MKGPNKKSMLIPSHIEFHKDSERILRYTLQASNPEEGCALLLGKSIKLQNKTNVMFLKIELIWPCCNIWISEMDNKIKSVDGFNPNHKKKTSRKNRFRIDPLEQFFAQKWGRERDLQVLGTAHSHPLGKATPSSTDISLSVTPNLMIILNGITKEIPYSLTPRIS